MIIEGVGIMKGILNFIKYFPRHMFEAILSFSASAYVIAIFLIKDNITIPLFPQGMEWASYLIYLVVPVLIAFVWLALSKLMPACAIECKICEVELASHSFLPSYLGYFFVALSIPNLNTLWYVYAVILLFTHLSKALSFNPLFLLFGYQFYFVTSEDGAKIFLITKQNMKNIQDVDLSKLRRINDFTFIDVR